MPEHVTVYGTSTWFKPDADPLWEDWMNGATITVTISVATEKGQYDYTTTATIDYETANCSCVMDATGLDPGYRWAFSSVVKEQTITGPQGQQVTVKTNTAFRFLRDGDPLIQSINLGLLQLSN